MRFRTFLALVFLLLLAYCGRFAWENSARSPARFSTFPVAFASQDQVLVLSEQDILKFSLDDLGKGSVVFKMPKELRETHVFSSGSCFSLDRWLLRTRQQQGSLITGGPPIEVLINKGQILNWRILSDLPFVQRWNEHDCEVVQVSKGPLPLVANPRDGYPGLEARQEPTLVSRRHAQHMRVAADFGTLVLEYHSEGEHHRHELASSKMRLHKDRAYQRAQREPQTAIYWLNSPFAVGDGGRPSNWPVTSWRVDFKQHKAEVVELPAGPWVADHKERFSCFSCGCGCYRKVDFYPAGDNIVSHVSGHGFPAPAQGLYVLNYRSEQPVWAPLYIGNSISKPLIAPSGCDLIFMRRRFNATDRLASLNFC